MSAGRRRVALTHREAADAVVRYGSQFAAAVALGVSISTIQKRIREGRTGAGQPGRPPVFIDWEKVRTLSSEGRSLRQIAGMLGMTATTLHRRLLKHLDLLGKTGNSDPKAV